MEAIQQLPIMKNLPAGVTNRAVGNQRWQQELIQNFIIAVVAGILMVFAVLVLLYRRFVSPLVNMTSLLLAPLGGLLALGLISIVSGHPQPISIAVYIGLLMLLGIVAKNSILLIDFAIEEMESGVPKKQAILDAGHKRAQPILMTTVAMTAGHDPDRDLDLRRRRLALGDGHHGDRRPDPVDAADAGHRAGRVQHRRRARETPRPVAAPQGPDLSAGRRARRQGTALSRRVRSPAPPSALLRRNCRRRRVR
jgi:hypothetical protein